MVRPEIQVPCRIVSVSKSLMHSLSAVGLVAKRAGELAGIVVPVDSIIEQVSERHPLAALVVAVRTGIKHSSATDRRLATFPEDIGHEMEKLLKLNTPGHNG